MPVLPRHVLCALGTWKTFATVERVVAEVGGDGFTIDREYSQLEPDTRMPVAFDISRDRVSPSWTDDDERAVERHRAVAYILSPPMPAAAALAISGRALAVVAALLDAGALAIKAESSGIAHGASRWHELARQALDRESLTRMSALHAAWVRRPLDDEGVHYSCGMHLLGERDAEVTASADALADVGWLDLLAIYLLAEKPARGMRDGEGFRRKPGGERRVLRARKCTRYEEDDFFFNPYGYWRLEPSEG